MPSLPEKKIRALDAAKKRIDSLHSHT